MLETFLAVSDSQQYFHFCNSFYFSVIIILFAKIKLHKKLAEHSLEDTPVLTVALTA